MAGLVNNFFKKHLMWKLYTGFSIFSLAFLGAMFWLSRIRIKKIFDKLPEKNFYTTSLEHELLGSQGLIFFLATLGLLIVLSITFLFVRYLDQPLSEMMTVCEAFKKGDYSQRVLKKGSGGLQRLAETLNSLGEEITAKIARISHERAQLKTMLSSMVEGIVAIDEQNRVQFCNRAAYELLDSPLEDCRGMSLVDLEGFCKLEGLVGRTRRLHQLADSETEISVDGDTRTLECYASSFLANQSEWVIIVLHDISKIRKLERVRRDFVANVSHEIKTPLTNIKGFSETLLSGALSDTKNCRRFVEKIDRNAARLKTLVQDLLSLAKIESDHEQLERKPTNWSDIVSQIVSLYEDDLDEKNLQVDIRIPEDEAEPKVLGHRDSMYQILDNLFSNAIRYTPQGGRIEIILSEEKDFVVLEVKDSGIGISQKNIKRIFERFYRVDKARTRELGGTGLGLSIVRHLVSKLHGEIKVESEMGSGSRFSVSLEKGTVPSTKTPTGFANRDDGTGRA